MFDVAPTRTTGLQLYCRSEGPSPYRSHRLRSLFQVPPKSYQKPTLKPGRLSIWLLGNCDSLPLVSKAEKNRRSSKALIWVPAANCKLSFSASNIHSVIAYSTNC